MCMGTWLGFEVSDSLACDFCCFDFILEFGPKANTAKLVAVQRKLPGISN
jgi:hypothetical protein